MTTKRTATARSKASTQSTSAARAGAALARDAATSLADVYSHRGRTGLSNTHEKRWARALKLAGVSTNDALDDAHWEQVDEAERAAFLVGVHTGLRMSFGKDGR